MANPSDPLAPCIFERRSAFTTISNVICLFGDLCMLPTKIHTVVCVIVMFMMFVARDAKGMCHAARKATRIISTMILQGLAMLFSVEDRIMLLSNPKQEDKERIVRYKSDKQQYEHDSEDTD